MFDNSLLLSLTTALSIVALVYIYYRGKLKMIQSNYDDAVSKSNLLATELNQERNLLQDAHERLHRVELEKTKLSADLENLRARYDNEVKNIDGQIEKFENLANRVLHFQSKSLHEKQEAGMKEILTPLKEKLKSFEDKIERTNLESTKQNESLKEQIKMLNEKSEQVSRDADNLVKALKGDFKQQGNWGELILDSILDKSGLVKDREYFLQNSAQNSEGKTMRPDVVIQLPDDKKIIIDSKVSLVAYEAMANAENEEDQRLHQKAHFLATKTHIDGLASKNYHELYGIQSPDFVLMFIPIDTALGAALSYDNNLYAYAFDKNIVLVSSSTLLATLKTVESMWRNDKQNRFAIQIADEAGKMYDKFVGFVDEMDKLKNQMNTSNNTFNEAMKKLSTGTGNLVKRAEKIKSLGARASKKLNQRNVD